MSTVLSTVWPSFPHLRPDGPGELKLLSQALTIRAKDLYLHCWVCSGSEDYVMTVCTDSLIVTVVEVVVGLVEMVVTVIVTADMVVDCVQVAALLYNIICNKLFITLCLQVKTQIIAVQSTHSHQYAVTKRQRSRLHTYCSMNHLCTFINEIC